MTNLEF